MDNIAHVPRERWGNVAGKGSSASRYFFDAVTGEEKTEIELYQKYGAVYDLEINATYPADPEIIKRFRAGKIRDIEKVVGGRGGAITYPKYEIGYSWGYYTIIDYAESKKRGYTGTNYIARCECGTERIMRSSAIGENKCCVKCRYRR